MQSNSIFDAAGLQYAPAILAKLAPERTRREGSYIEILNPNRPDRNFGSFRFDCRTGRWWEFALSIHGHGVASLVRYLLQTDDADQVLAYLLQKQDERPENLPVEITPLATEILQSEGLLPSGSGLPDDRPSEPLWDCSPQPELSSVLLASIFPSITAPPSAIFEYRDVRGDVVQRVVRWDSGVIPWARGKVIRPLIFARPHGDDSASVAPSWVPAWAPKIPLLNTPDLVDRIGSPILWVEGERAAQAAGHYAPPGVAVTTAGGGLLGRVDWGLIVGRNLVIWPDSDQPGQRYAEKVAAKARLVGARSVIILEPPIGAPKGWDLADAPVDAGTTAEAIRKQIADAFAGSRLVESTGKGFDLSLIEAIRTDLVKPPTRMLPAWQTWANDTGKAKDVEAEGLLLGLMVAASGPMAGVIDVQARPGYVEPAALNCAIVGPSGSKKSPWLDAIVDPIRREELDRAGVYEIELQRWALDKKIAKIQGDPEPLKPVRDQITQGDHTPDAFLVLQALRSCGLLEVWGEGSNLIGSFTRYSNGGNGLSSARALMLEKYDCKRQWYSRRKLGDDPILTLVASSCLTTMQPDVCGSFLGASRQLADGLDARWILYSPDPRFGGLQPIVDPASFNAHEKFWQRAIGRIYTAAVAAGSSKPHGGRRVIPLDSDAMQVFDRWRNDYLVIKARDFGGDVPGWTAKAAGHVLRLALGMYALNWAADEKPVESFFEGKVDAELIQQAIELRVGWLESHRQRAEMEAGQPLPEKLASTLARWAVQNGVTAIDTVTLRRHVRLNGLRTPENILAALLELAAVGWAAPGQVLPPNLRNAHLPSVFMLNPAAIRTARRHLKLEI